MATQLDTKTHYHLFDTAIGTCGVAWGPRGVSNFQLPEANTAATERRLRTRSGGEACDPPPDIASLIADIRRYFAGECVDFTAVAVDLRGVDDFRRAMLEALREVGWGRTTTYGDIGRAIGCSDARDIGAAMGKNPIPVIIPCHRVLAAVNKLGGFSAHGGAATKQKLLVLEGVHLDGGTPRLPGL